MSTFLKSLEDKGRRHRECCKRNRVKITARAKEKRRKDPEKFAKCRREYNKRNHTRIRERRRNFRKRFRLLIFEFLGNKCKKCGFSSDWRAFQIDHVGGGGRRERKGLRHRDIFRGKEGFEVIKASPEKYQLLCANCNQIKRYENGEGVGERKGEKLLLPSSS